MEHAKIIHFNEEHKSALSNPDFRMRAERLVIKCGVPAYLNGYNSLIDAVILHGTGTCKSVSEIYRVIGAKLNIKSRSVIRSISYAIDKSFDLPERLSSLTGIEIRRVDIHNALVIAYLGNIFRNPKLTAYA